MPTSDPPPRLAKLFRNILAVILLGLVIEFGIVCLAALLLIGIPIAISGCDLSCHEDTKGAELYGEGYYECDGKLLPVLNT